MEFDKKLVAGKLKRWESYMEGVRLGEKLLFLEGKGLSNSGSIELSEN